MIFKKLVQTYGTPLYVYDARTIRKRMRELRSAFPYAHLYYAAKANSNPALLKLIARNGLGIETVSPGEIQRARKAGVLPNQLSFTCANAAENEVISIAKSGVKMHLDSLSQVEWLGRRFPGTDISVRLNLGIGAGHHAHVVTGGSESKFGIPENHIGKLQSLARAWGLRIIGLHQHVGSNILGERVFLRAADKLLQVANRFPDVEELDFGGGFGIPHRPDEHRLNVGRLGRGVSARVARFSKLMGRRIAVSLEPGRYIVGEAGSLLVGVTDIKKNSGVTFVGVNSGMSHLIRPALYDSYHEVVNISRPRARKSRVTIAGHNCESGDLLARNRMLPMPEIGDILLIKNAGAYGFAMSSDYNLRPKPRELLIDGTRVIRI